MSPPEQQRRCSSQHDSGAHGAHPTSTTAQRSLTWYAYCLIEECTSWQFSPLGVPEVGRQCDSRVVSWHWIIASTYLSEPSSSNDNRWNMYEVSKTNYISILFQEIKWTFIEMLLIMLYKVWSNIYHLVNDWLPAPFVTSRITKRTLAVHGNYLVVERCRTKQLQNRSVSRTIGV